MFQYKALLSLACLKDGKIKRTQSIIFLRNAATEELSGSDEENELSVEEEIIPAQPPPFKVYKVNGRAICRSKCQHCGTGSSSYFYRFGNFIC